ncbi:hypothetical protein ACLOJK_004343 [Asimina triloba]
MEFPHGREGHCEEEEEEEEKHSMLAEETGKHPFRFSPSSSPSPALSSSHCKGVGAAAVAAAATNFMDLSGGGNSGASGNLMEREHMFDKVVTPSDVGKLNRLVIPKQHAEKYFPLDSGSNEKGLLLNFVDPSGKPWRFRYSYWNSSQSYVMTKGWSRFVKEKKLDAGDIVSFERGVGESGRDRLFIDWKRRPDAAAAVMMMGVGSSHHHHAHFPYPMPTLQRSSPPWAGFFPPHSHLIHVQQQQQDFGSPYGYNAAAAVNQPAFYHLQSRGPLQQMGRVQGGAGGDGDDASQQMVFDSAPVVHGKPAAAGKRLRLFGVNLDYPTTDAADTAHSLSSTTSLIPQTSALAPRQSSLYNGSSSALPSDQQKGKESLSFDLDS